VDNAAAARFGSTKCGSTRNNVGHRDALQGLGLFDGWARKVKKDQTTTSIICATTLASGRQEFAAQRLSGASRM
jgi:hypothetical protein